MDRSDSIAEELRQVLREHADNMRALLEQHRAIQRSEPILEEQRRPVPAVLAARVDDQSPRSSSPSMFFALRRAAM